MLSMFRFLLVVGVVVFVVVGVGGGGDGGVFWGFSSASDIRLRRLPIIE